MLEGLLVTAIIVAFLLVGFLCHVIAKLAASATAAQKDLTEKLTGMADKGYMEVLLASTSARHKTAAAVAEQSIRESARRGEVTWPPPPPPQTQSMNGAPPPWEQMPPGEIIR